jgi:hypothetical protein
VFEFVGVKDWGVVDNQDCIPSKQGQVFVSAHEIKWCSTNINIVIISLITGYSLKHSN